MFLDLSLNVECLLFYVVRPKTKRKYTIADRADKAMSVSQIRADLIKTKKCKNGCDRLDETIMLRYRVKYYNKNIKQDFERRQLMLTAVIETIRNFVPG